MPAPIASTNTWPSYGWPGSLHGRLLMTPTTPIDGIGGHGLDRPGEDRRVDDGRAGHVERILHGTVGGHDPGERVAGRRGQFGQLGAEVLGPVGDDVAGAAGDRHDADARPVQPAERRGGPGGDQHVLDRVHPDDAQVGEDRVDHPVVADQRAGVRGRGPGGQRAAAGLEHHDGLARRGGAARGPAEHLRFPHGLHEDGHRPGPRIVDQEIQHVPGGDHRLVAQRDQVGQADVDHQGEVQHGRGAGTALRQQRDRAALPGQTGDRTNRHAVGEVGEAEMVRAEQHHAERGGVPRQLGLRGPACVARLGVARRQHARVADPGGRRVVECLEHARLRDHQVGHVDRLADMGARGHGGPTMGLAPRRLTR